MKIAMEIGMYRIFQIYWFLMIFKFILELQFQGSLICILNEIQMNESVSNYFN